MSIITQEAFGGLVRRYRRGAELTQEGLAERAGISVRLVRAIEAGSKHRPRQDTVQLLLEALAVPVEEQAEFLAAAGHVASAITVSESPTEASAPHTSQLLTILIADMRGYTRFTVERGDEAAAELAERFAASTRDVVERHGGTTLELRGDEALCVFPSARQALRAALALQDQYLSEGKDGGLPLGVGIGLDAGEVVPVDSGYRGRALNLAARLCSLAKAGDVLVSEGVLHLAGAMEGIAFVDRGPVALKGLPEPVQVIQIGQEGELPATLPPLQPTLAIHLTNLPDEPTSFIGREREIDQIAGLLQDPQIRLVTLTGTGGVGKTRLALQVGNTLLHDFRDGVFFVSLVSLADPALVPAAVAEVLGIKEEPGRVLLTSLAAHLREKHLLLVLDNFEHLLDAAPIVASLLDACRELHVLVTSRSPLHLSREYQHAVPPLLVPDPKQAMDAEKLAQYESVTLFIERAQAAKDTFTMTSGNAPAVAEICYRLDGLPLAIELAAARIKLFPPQALLQRLSHALNLLTGGRRDVPARQQTLRNTIDWSYHLLTPDEQTLFARLSVFTGGCTFEAAEAVCISQGEFDLLEGIASLLDKSLLRQEGEAEPRFGMLETLREYAAERLAEQRQVEALQRRHAEYFTTLAEAADPELIGPEQGFWLERLECERDNLRAALEWSCNGGNVELGLRLAIALGPFWLLRGPLSDGRHWLSQVLAAGDQGLSERVRTLQAEALFVAGQLASSQGRDLGAADLLERSVALYRELGDRPGRAKVCSALALELLQRGDLETAMSLLQEGVELSREIGETGLLEMSLRLLEVLAERRGDADQAEGYREQHRLVYREREGRGLTASGTHMLRGTTMLYVPSWNAFWADHAVHLAFIAKNWGDYGEAVRVLEEQLAHSLEVGDRRRAAFAQCFLAIMAREQGAYERSEALYQESQAVFDELEDRSGRALALLGLSALAIAQGNVEQAVALAEHSLALFRETGDPLFTAFCLRNLAVAAQREGDYGRAAALLDEALALARKLGDPTPIAEVLAHVGSLALDRRDSGRAAQAFTEGLMIARAAGLRILVATLLEGMAAVAASTRQMEWAAQLLGAAHTLRSTLGTPIQPANQAVYAAQMALVRAALREESWASAWDEGATMTIEEAIAFALQTSGV